MKKVKPSDGITPWKLDSAIERFLGAKADKSYFWKKLYVKLYKVFDKEYYKKGMKFIEKNITLFRGTVSKKEKKKLIIDMVYSLHRFGCGFDEYFLYNFPTLDTEGRESFVTDKIRWDYYHKFNTNEGNAIFNDKKRTYDLFGKYFGRKVITLETNQDKEKFLDFVSTVKQFVVKPINSSGGRGVYKIKINGTINLDKTFEDIIVNGAVVLEEVIQQSKKMSSLHPQSVNTLRVPTIRDKFGVHLFHPLLRVGVGESITDNATSGGIFALIDENTGIVCSEARDEKDHCFEVHPDTSVKFKGFQIPNWEQLVKLAEEVAMVVKDNHYVGWDFAHTDNGWVIVEGNPRGQIIMMQLFFERGFKQELLTYADNLI